MRRTLAYGVYGVCICLLAPLLGAAQSGPSSSVAVQSAVAPVYPPLARTANVSGNAEVTVTVDRAGDVTKATFVTGNQLLHKAAVEAAKRWKFERGNEEIKVQLIFSFRMMPKETPQEDMTPVFTPPYRIEVRGKLPEPTVNYRLSAHTNTTH